MSTPHEPHPDPSGGSERQSEPPQAGAQPPTEKEPAPSAAPSAHQAGAEEPTAAPPPDQQAAFGMPPPPPGQAGHYVFVPAGQRGRFGPGFGRFVRSHATHLVAAVVVGALVGGGTVAIVDNAADHRPGPVFRQDGPFDGHRFPGFGFGRGGQGFGN